MHRRTGPGENALEPGAARRAAIWQAAIVVPLALATLLGLVVLWPGESPAGSVPVTAESVTLETGVITQIGETDEVGSTEVRMSLTGADMEVPVHVPAEIVANGLDVGDRIEAMFTPAAIGTGTPYIFWDFERDVPLWLLIGAYILVVALVARGKGLAAVAGLALSLAIVVLFMLPALLAGQNPLLVVLVGAGAMMFASIYLAHGISIRTTTAILGTAGGLLVTGLLAVIASDRTNLTGTLSDSALSLTGYGIQLDQILICGMILAGLGALNDVTITQVSTVWELRAANPASTAAQLYRQGMVVGRDHIASTIYTLAFAYVGTALPLLMSAAVIDRTFLDTLATGEIAEEIVRTLVASIGLVLAIPLTTGIAARLARA
ncbi:YibE/F family protein [Flaviflexus salsibiostraticola]|uniref:YibE/F family protein n=1 Tax=Flaviflexus salsibiostraticola TaxID=1282737 RepID=A0A3Q8WS38_9ACTO|nr:YibE/F family protein [Flaviflexus salsibiostraticola]AZN28971.1 YibE/F family protein [Flaviflexus salsibiostraticola]